MAPIEGFYRYHLIYLAVSSVLAWAFYPYQVYISFCLMGLLCVVGIACLLVNQYVLSQAVALSIGLAAPIIFFAQLALGGSLLLLGMFLIAAFLARDLLFFS